MYRHGSLSHTDRCSLSYREDAGHIIKLPSQHKAEDNWDLPHSRNAMTIIPHATKASQHQAQKSMGSTLR
eukprot:398239-Pelagomonas_calceolata.AAC.2